MQRWKLWAVLVAMGLVVMLFGGWYARKEYYLRKPDKVWVPLPFRADLSMEDQIKEAKRIENMLRTDRILRQVVIDVGLIEKFKQTSEDAAIKELNRRLFVEVGSADTPNGLVPSINIGVRGIGHENQVLRDSSTRIIREVFLMIGIHPDTLKPLDPGNTPPPDSF